LDFHADRQLSELMRRAQDGDHHAYDLLLHEVAQLVRSYVRRRVGGADQAEDIVQETLLSIHSHRHTYDPARPFRPWLYAIARHRLLDAVGKQRSRWRHEVRDDVDVGALAAARAEPAGLSAFIRYALTQLSHAQREVIQMLKLDGYSVAEVSQRTGRSESLVKVTAHRGYKSLRKLMEEEFRDE
jgi:RNA polymerase sigma-70 factor (ECF subfamily)